MGRLKQLGNEVKPLITEKAEVTAESVEAFKAQWVELEAAVVQLGEDRAALMAGIEALPMPEELETNEAQHGWAEQFGAQVSLWKAVQKETNQVYKLVGRGVELAEKQLGARGLKGWNSRCGRSGRGWRRRGMWCGGYGEAGAVFRAAGDVVAAELGF